MRSRMNARKQEGARVGERAVGQQKNPEAPLSASSARALNHNPEMQTPRAYNPEPKPEHSGTHPS